jgi:hypothetical protein
VAINIENIVLGAMQLSLLYSVDNNADAPSQAKKQKFGAHASSQKQPAISTLSDPRFF